MTGGFLYSRCLWVGIKIIFANFCGRQFYFLQAKAPLLKLLGFASWASAGSNWYPIKVFIDRVYLLYSFCVVCPETPTSIAFFAWVWCWCCSCWVTEHACLAEPFLVWEDSLWVHACMRACRGSVGIPRSDFRDSFSSSRKPSLRSRQGTCRERPPFSAGACYRTVERCLSSGRGPRRGTGHPCSRF